VDASSVWSVLKWVLAVLAAGFIGQFGRVLAMRLIERRRTRGHRSASESGDDGKGVSLQSQLEQGRLKAEKKRVKAELKKGKKESKH